MKLENLERLMKGQILLMPENKKQLWKIENSGSFMVLPMFLEWLYLSGFEVVRSKGNNFADMRRKCKTTLPFLGDYEEVR